MTTPRRALDFSNTEATQRPQRVLENPPSAFFSAFDRLSDVFATTPTNARRVARPWYTGWVARVGVVAGVGLTATALAAAVALPTSVEEAPVVAAVSIPEARTLAAGILAEPSDVSDDLVSQIPMYANVNLTIRKKATQSSKELGTLTWGTEVLAASQISGDYRLIETEGIEGWVLADKLVKEDAEIAAGITMAPCPRGSAIEGKLRADTIKIYRSVCALFPDVNSYGGWRSGGRSFHKNGRALDIMLTPKKESALGWKIAQYLTSHYKEFNIDHVIFEQKIWTPRSPHWRKMADRGSITENHYNHVHVAIKA